MKTERELLVTLEEKGYLPTEAVMIAKGRMDENALNQGGTLGDLLELDRLNVFRAFYGDNEQAESTWVAGEDGGGLKCPRWKERLIHAEILYIEGTLDRAIDYLLRTA